MGRTWGGLDITGVGIETSHQGGGQGCGPLGGSLGLRSLRMGAEKVVKVKVGLVKDKTNSLETKAETGCRDGGSRDENERDR